MMGKRNSFLTPLVVLVMPSGKTFKVAREFTYVWFNIPLHVPVGFVTDFASIPKICRLLIPKLGRYTKASVIHDALYQDAISDWTFTRALADQCFREGMKELGVIAWKRWAMWFAVRLVGWALWRKR